MKIKLEGTAKELKRYLEKVNPKSFMDLHEEILDYEKVQNKEVVKMTCYLGEAEKKIVTYVLSAVNGEKIKIPLLRNVKVEVGKSVAIYGGTFDIFQNKEKSHNTMDQEMLDEDSIITFLEKWSKILSEK